MTIRNIVLEGGGIRGLAYVGACKYLDEIGIYKNLLNIGGTSIGALVGFHVALGYTSFELEKQLFNLDLNRLRDGRFKLYSLFSKFGLHSGDYLANYLKDCLLDKGFPTTSTISSIGEQTNKWLSVVATNVNRGSKVVFSRDNDLSIVEAVRMSSALPFFFTARRYKNELYVDGALVNNYPLELFDKIEQRVNPNGDVTTTESLLNNTIGIRVDSEREIDNRVDYPCSTLLQFTQSMLNIMYDNLQDSNMGQADWQRTIRIDIGDVGTTDFDIPPEKVIELINRGYTATANYFSSKL